ncbi:nitric oxide dioxygenase [Flavobacterium nitrogenifigens]|uniref:Flavohemoprotein n=2 Tax=Flavobacterium TaxID=237 RepID=A0A7W7N7L4_9FLAO|nr:MULTISPECIES: NO-inducible flavohemoprotein [Flavobacterium]MBB4801604.1 nitric oxide dioxygenase [Flavobacterium nitrogenifigens]MBB6386562.1 nitric oxide dioxygenase [Flavobacterium notoginsengisoli]
MNSDQKELIKATVPILRSSGEDLTNYFYARMFKHHPELQNMFNMGNQANGRQKSALANAVLAYAENIDNPSVLLGVLKGIGTKHRSLNIQPEQYKIVGTHLIASIGEVVGEAATPEILEAWTVAFYQLAQIMIDLEKQLYNENEAKPGSWNGWRKFVIKKIVEESTEIKSFYLYPEDGKEIADFHPGQFISVQVFVEELNLLQPRQYSLSSAFNPEYYRISVKRENGIAPNPSGMVSNTLHSKSEGDVISISSPAGIFHLEKDSENPLVLISGGVGFTPMLSMLETNLNALQNKKTVWIHGCRNESVHAFKSQISNLKQEVKWLETFTFYDSVDNLENSSEQILQGRVDLHKCKEAILLDEAKFYICGPELFIRSQYESLLNLNVKTENIFYEEFGPQLINLN